ncbi:MAG: DNA helicase RecQ [Bacteroidales bacterium]|nr:DNA helicase RecQ [Bacteroidales bacterium]
MAKAEKSIVEYDLKGKLKEFFGFDQFKGDQEEIIRSVIEGNDTLVIMPTGSGKSLCYQLPALILPGTAVIVSPLIALMKNQVDALRYNAGIDQVAHFLNSSLTKQKALQVKLDLVDKKTKLLYVAPETLNKEDTIDFLASMNISFFAIDEAHCISEWGHDFRPEYRTLRDAASRISPKVPMLALTASATPRVQLDILKNLQMEKAKRFVSSFNRPNLYYEVRPKPEDTNTLHKEIIRIILDNEEESGIIYCLTRRKVEELAELLQQNGIRALPYHAGLDSAVRTENQDKFLNEEVDVIVATIAFGMGIDKPDIRFIVHYDIPKSLEGYYQETGRAGRDGNPAKCIVFYSEHDVERLYRFFTDKSLTEQEQSLQLVNEVVSYAETSVCRRRALLKYFGEDYDEENCGNCDNCTHPRKHLEAKEEMALALETIVAMKQGFKVNDVIDVLLGNKTTNVKNYRHNQLPQFGQGMDHDVLYWRAVLREGLFENLLVKIVEQYGVLQVTPKGSDFIKKPYEVMVPCDHNYEKELESEETGLASSAGGEGVGDERLYAMLKEQLRTMAKRANLPPYVIFEDRSLKDMTIQYPCNNEELSHCAGVGMGKAQKYGGPFIDLIQRYVEDNDIIRPRDIVLRTSGSSKSVKDKVHIITALDRRTSFDDIAKGLNMKMGDLLGCIEDIIASGTKLNLDYYIDEEVDHEHMEDLLAYWHEAESSSLEDALEEFYDDDYTEEEIRLSRIKFLNDVGN